MNNILQPARESFYKSTSLLKKHDIKKAKRKIDLEKQAELEAKREKLEYKKSITKETFNGINAAVKLGMFTRQFVLQENWSKSLNNNCFKFDDVIKELMLDLKSKGYDVYYGPNEVCHDTSDAYMNSGGEYGSSTPRYSTTLELIVSWNRPS